MKGNTKKGVDFPSRAAMLGTETGGAARSDRARIAFKKRSRRRLPSTLEGSAALSYADIGFFFVSVFFLAMIFRIGVRLHVLNQTRLDNPTLPFQVAISLSLIGSLYAIIRLRLDAMSGPFLDGSGLVEFILLPPCWAGSGLELGSTSLLMPRLQPLT